MKKSFFVKTVLMLVSFVCVIYIMRLLQQAPMAEQGSASESTVMSLFTGDLRPMNWCPPETKSIEIAGAATKLSSAQEIARFCEIFIEPTTQEDAQIDDYQVVITASAERISKKIEKNSRGVFRAEGMPFRSRQLAKGL